MQIDNLLTVVLDRRRQWPLWVLFHEWQKQQVLSGMFVSAAWIFCARIPPWRLRLIRWCSCLASLLSHRTAFLACAYETCLSDLYPFVKFGWNYRRTKKLGEIDENKWRQTRWAHPFFGPWKSWLHFSSDCSFLLVSHSLLSIKPSSIPVLAPMLVNHVPNLAFPLTTIDT